MEERFSPRSPEQAQGPIWMVAHEILRSGRLCTPEAWPKTPSVHGPDAIPRRPSTTCSGSAALRGTCGPRPAPCFSRAYQRVGPRWVPARRPWGGPELEGVDSTGIHLALAHPQRYQGCHLGHQKPAGGARYGTPPCMRAKGNINAAGVPDGDIRTGGPGSHGKGPGRHRSPALDAPSPLWLREQRASGPEERGSPLSPLMAARVPVLESGVKTD